VTGVQTCALPIARSRRPLRPARGRRRSVGCPPGPASVRCGCTRSARAARTAPWWRSCAGGGALLLALFCVVDTASVLGQLHGRAVLPEPREGIELALFLMLDVHHDLAVVQQRPAPLSDAFASHRLDAFVVHRFLDGV